MSTPTASACGADLADVRSGVRLKVCGITEAREIEVLVDESVDFVGLWFGVPGGPADLAPDTWRRLAAQAAASPRPAPVLVTFEKDKEVLRGALEGTQVRWIQLHGYQTPGLVRALKRMLPDLRIIKVLHVRGEACVEEPLIGTYEKAGVDVFLFDAVTEEGRVGSTGESLDVGAAAALAGRLTRPFLLAGGISAENRATYATLAAHPLFLGVDVDTNARGADGSVGPAEVRAISRAWKTPVGEGGRR
jgi:phosphoribosylanthranilate isomerase